ncbi:hypothetical protein AB1388_11405 [Streptomyces hydrogenans]|uniref:hypothetical protein n=1 Tax=Streptomyces hydrogenans TaxID=1873719 RepID=UPI00345C7992
MNVLKRVAVVGASTAMLGAAMTATASTASAAQLCKSYGNGGQVCVSTDPNGYGAWMVAGASATWDFNLKCANGKWAGDQGSFYRSIGQTASYTFRTAKQPGGCAVVLINVSSGATYTTPYI